MALDKLARFTRSTLDDSTEYIFDKAIKKINQICLNECCSIHGSAHSVRKNEYACFNLCDVISNIHELGFKLDNIAVPFFRFAIYSDCFKTNSDTIILTMLKIMDKYVLNEAQLLMEFKLLDKFDNQLSKRIIDLVFDNLEINHDNIRDLCCCRHEYMLRRLAMVIDKYDGKFTIDIMYRACEFYPESKIIVLALMARGLEFDSQCLKIVCGCCSSTDLDDILSNCKIELTSEHFNAVIDGRSDSISVLLKYGYIYTKEDIIKSITRKITLPNLIESGLKFDRILLEHCLEYDFFPDCDFAIECGMNYLRIVCKMPYLGMIRNVVNKYDIIPDEECMINACSFSSNIFILKFLVSKGGIVTAKCIESAISTDTTKAFLVLLIGEYVTQTREMNNRIEYLEKQIAQLRESQ